MDISLRIEELNKKISNAANQMAQNSNLSQQLQGYIVRLQEEVRELQAGNEATDSDKSADTSAEQQVSAA